MTSDRTPILTTLFKFTPFLIADCGDYVVVINAKAVKTTGTKAQDKLYRSHSGYPGGLKETTFENMMEKDPDAIIRKAVSGMLPKNRLREPRLGRLFVFEGEDHPYEQNIIKRYDALGKETRLDPSKVEA